MQTQQPILLQEKNRVKVRAFQQIDIQPTPISYLFYESSQANLYVSRQKSSEVYHISKSNTGQFNFHHIARLPWSKYIMKTNGVLALFCPFELRVWLNSKWVIHSFTTELISIAIKGSIVYSFHEEQAIEWTMDQDDFRMSYVSKGKVPYHLSKVGQLEGYGKKIQHFLKSKGNQFTCCQYKLYDYIVAGDDSGSLFIYDFATTGHLKSFKKHQGPILSIKIDQKTDTIFYSGSDSKLCSVKRQGNSSIEGEWNFVGEIRGQSHDIYSVEMISQNCVITGGITTDICCYPLYNQETEAQQQLEQQPVTSASNSSLSMFSFYYNRISYSSEVLLSSMDRYILVNKITSFEIWKCLQRQNDMQFIVRYQMPNQKFIKTCKISKRLEDGTHLIVASSQIDTIAWKFSEKQGLSKVFTIKNSYDFIEFLSGKNIFVGLRDSGEVEKVYCKSGKILEIVNSVGIDLPTEMKLVSAGSIGEEKLIIGSNLSKQIKVIDLKKKEILITKPLERLINVICEKNQKQFIIKYLNDQSLYVCSFHQKGLGGKLNETKIKGVELPAENIRFADTIIHLSQAKSRHLKRYWYFTSDNKVYLVNNLNSINEANPKKIKIRSIFTKQIGCALKPKANKNWEIGIVNYNFRRMIDASEVQPLIVKKIIK